MTRYTGLPMTLGNIRENGVGPSWRAARAATRRGLMSMSCANSRLRCRSVAAMPQAASTSQASGLVTAIMSRDECSPVDLQKVGVGQSERRSGLASQILDQVLQTLPFSTMLH